MGGLDQTTERVGVVRRTSIRPMMMVTWLPRRSETTGPYWLTNVASSCGILGKRKKGGFSCSREVFAPRGRDALDEHTYFCFGIGFPQNHVAGGPGGSGIPLLCVRHP